MKAVNYTMQSKIIRFAVCLRAAQGGNFASDTEISSDDSDGEGGPRSQHICSCQIQGAWPTAHSQSSARVDDGDESSMAGSGQMDGFKPESCIELPRARKVSARGLHTAEAGGNLVGACSCVAM